VCTFNVDDYATLMTENGFQYIHGTDSKGVLSVPTHSVGATTHSVGENHGIGQCTGRGTATKYPQTGEKAKILVSVILHQPSEIL
jgi:hypothetical protein